MRAVTRSRALRRTAGLVVAASVLVGCVQHPGLPALSTSAYTAKGSLTAEGAISSLATTSIALQAQAKGRATSVYLAAVVSDQEDSLEGVATAFDAVATPTTSAERLRSQLSPLLAKARSDLADVRIALDDDNQAKLRTLAKNLEADRNRLDKFVTS